MPRPAASRKAEPRSSGMRVPWPRALADEARDRQYEAAYRAQPEDESWAKVGARILASRLAKDRW